MTAPAVSVLLPVRDAGPFLDDCITSLERQTLSDYEVICPILPIKKGDKV